MLVIRPTNRSRSTHGPSPAPPACLAMKRHRRQSEWTNGFGNRSRLTWLGNSRPAGCNPTPGSLHMLSNPSLMQSMPIDPGPE